MPNDSAAPIPVATPMLFYDGECGLCAHSVRWVLSHEGRRRDLSFISLQGPTARALKQRHPWLETVDSLIWLEADSAGRPGRPQVRSDAVLAALRYVGGAWGALAAAFRLVPWPLRDTAYDLVARHRHGLHRNPECLLPAPEQRTRFPELSGAASNTTCS